ncbi:hypothetical protein PIB30_103948, partial [Stylosanthes scabra]|nr:hypothetical protein [Stylosanthes scabra]
SLILIPTLATTTHRGSYAPFSQRRPCVHRPGEVAVAVLKLEAIPSSSLRPSPSVVLTGCSEVLKLEAFLFAPSQQSFLLRFLLRLVGELSCHRRAVSSPPSCSRFQALLNRRCCQKPSLWSPLVLSDVAGVDRTRNALALPSHYHCTYSCLCCYRWWMLSSQCHLVPRQFG